MHNLMTYEKNKTLKQMFTSYKHFTSFKQDSGSSKTPDDDITAIELVELRSDVADSSCEVNQEVCTSSNYLNLKIKIGSVVNRERKGALPHICPIF